MSWSYIILLTNIDIILYSKINKSSYTLTTTRDTYSLYNLIWHWCDQDKWCVKKYFSVALRVIFRVYMFEILSKNLSKIFHQGIKGWEVVSLNLRSLESRHSCPRRCSRICCCHRSCCRRRRFLTTVTRHHRFSHHCRSSPLIVSHRHSPPQPLSHEISLMQMGALDSYHVSNLKFIYLKSNYVIS